MKPCYLSMFYQYLHKEISNLSFYVYKYLRLAIPLSLNIKSSLFMFYTIDNKKQFLIRSFFVS